MARTSKGGGGALVLAIVFGLAVLITGGLAIMFFVQRNEAMDAEQTAKRQLTDVATQAEQDRARALLPPENDGGTIVRQLIDELTAIKLLVTSDPEKPAKTIREQLEANGFNADENVETAVARFRAEERSDKSEIANLQDNIASLQDQLAAKARENEALFAKTTDAINSITRNYEDRQQGFSTYREQQDLAVDTLSNQLTNVRSQTRDQVAELTGTIEQQRRTIDDLQNRIDELTQPSSTTSTAEVRPELLPDGNIVSIREKEDIVYINLGRKDRVTPGLTFEVFDRLRGVQVDENGDQRGKATIEIVSITSDTASVARIVRRTPNTSLVEGDLIANAVYDPNMVLSFHVVGEFDLDNTGNPTRSDRSRVESMIEQWGGNVVNELTYNTDFLVLGPPPELPEPLAADEIDPQKVREYQEAQLRYETYQKLVYDAQQLRIPVLNQNRFLVLVGYYRR